MNKLQSTDEILNSWKRCMENEELKGISSPVLYIKKGRLNSILEENKIMISIFDSLSKEIITSIKEILLLTDSNGFLIKKILNQ